MRIAGARADSIFLQESVARVHERSGGIPRLVNLLCAQGLSVAASRQTTRVTPRMIEDAAARICAKAATPGIREFASQNPESAESVYVESLAAGAASPSGLSPATVATNRTTRRQKRAARRARIADAMRRASKAEAHTVAHRVRAAQAGSSTQPQPSALQAPMAATVITASPK